MSWLWLLLAVMLGFAVGAIAVFMWVSSFVPRMWQ